ncbi:bifunctional metallophosphatase/5'-nucleotidase [Sphingomonas naphthae]|uniref:Bifunctional metallophosphatase/5'-nucleotidase n=1 Tax=Sphingomonas naphthae TaxID=1813468 RepID=A0ABY7TM02_9SPHN|nr:bifunctional metallophosphatase/5'-nucleotidase [Sphingomonas naphthae]WCT74257.1 bifunctional metallophosphatase/5'-nucleotidase [Sphingomonas naphthae]
MTVRYLALAAMALLSGCAGRQTPYRAAAPGSVAVKLIALNDFHGALEPPKKSIAAPARAGGTVEVPAGGVAYLASAVASLKAANPNNAVVAAGDMISASPLISALFLDEPAIEAMNRVGLDYSALGNHEFDKGRQELFRITHGGCTKYTSRTPCQVDKAYAGARFGYLAANTLDEAGKPLFAPYAIKRIGGAKVGFIGLTLKDVPLIVDPAGIAGLSFPDEAATANALVPELRRQAVDAIVVLIHQGGRVTGGYNGCDGLDGDIKPILAKLDPAIDVVVSGHTHRAYVCDYAAIDPARPFLLTSAGSNGTLLTDIDLTIDRKAHKVTAKRATNVIVQGEGYKARSGDVALTEDYPRFPAAKPLSDLVARYAEEAKVVVSRPAGRLGGAAPKPTDAGGESIIGDLVADAMLAAMKPAGAELAFTNQGGIRAGLEPAADDSLNYGQIFSVLPFGNSIVVTGLTGRQILAVLEQQFDDSTARPTPYVLLPSANTRFSYDLSKPRGSRVVTVTVDGQPLVPDRTYRVALNSFLANGGDDFPGFKAGTDTRTGMNDVDALERYLAGPNLVMPPVADRTTEVKSK